MIKRSSTVIFIALWVVFSILAWIIFTKTTNYKSRTTSEKYSLLYSENALYYSFYKDIASAPTFTLGIKSLLSTNSIQYPQNLNVIAKYNLLPEIVLASEYRLFNIFGFKTEPMDFYIINAFILTGLTIALVFTSGNILSKSISGGILSVILFVTSWPYSTRALSFPAGREVFAIPFLLITLLTVYKIIESRSLSQLQKIVISISIIVQLFCWQFSFYNLLVFLIGICFASWASRKSIKKLQKFIWILIVTLSLMIVTGIVESRGVGGGTGHVTNYFLYRFGFISGDFHSMLYYCSGVFGPINSFLINFLGSNFLILFSIVGSYLLLQKPDKRIWIIWVAGFTVMALFANRFLVLAIPILSIVASEVFNSDYKKYLFGYLKPAAILLVSLSIILVSWNRIKNEVSNRIYAPSPNHISLMNWIKSNTDQNSVFSASMSLTPAIHLQTGRKITNNPFYEDRSSRQKNFEIYQIYNKRPEQDILEYLSSNKTDYIVVEDNLCFSQSVNGCKVEDLFTNEYKNSNLPNFCSNIGTNIKHFKSVYKNSDYSVYKVIY